MGCGIIITKKPLVCHGDTLGVILHLYIKDIFPTINFRKSIDKLTKWWYN